MIGGLAYVAKGRCSVVRRQPFLAIAGCSEEQRPTTHKLVRRHVAPQSDPIPECCEEPRPLDPVGSRLLQWAMDRRRAPAGSLALRPCPAGDAGPPAWARRLVRVNRASSPCRGGFWCCRWQRGGACGAQKKRDPGLSKVSLALLYVNRGNIEIVPVTAGGRSRTGPSYSGPRSSRD